MGALLYLITFRLYLSGIVIKSVRVDGCFVIFDNLSVIPLWYYDKERKSLWVDLFALFIMCFYDE